MMDHSNLALGIPVFTRVQTGYTFVSKSLQHSGSHQTSGNEEEAHLLLNEVVSYVSRMKSDDPYFKEFKVGIISSSRSQVSKHACIILHN